MNCAEAVAWLHLYMDGRLGVDQLAQLDRHLAACPSCRHERELLETLREALATQDLVAEPEQLSRQIMARVAAYEVRRAARPGRVAVQVRDVAWRLGLALALVVLALEVLQPSLWAGLVSGANRGAPQLVQALTAPGPNSVAWSIWALGVAAVLVVAMRIIRPGAYSSWLRSVTDRLPQLW